MDLSYIIKNAMDFLMLFVPGYIFLTVFNFFNHNQREDSKEHLIVKSVVGSYILVACWDGFINKLFVNCRLSSTILKPFILFFLAVFVSSILALLLRLSIVDSVVAFFSRTRSNDFWKDLNNKARKYDYTFVKVKFKDNSLLYKGQIELIESFQRDPIMALTYYFCYDIHGNIIQDYTKQERSLVFQFSQLEKLEFDYQIKNK